MQTTRTMTLTPPPELWRKLCEGRYTMAHCQRALRARKIRVTSATLYHWFREKTSPPLDRWARIEPVLKAMMK